MASRGSPSAGDVETGGSLANRSCLTGELQAEERPVLKEAGCISAADTWKDRECEEMDLRGMCSHLECPRKPGLVPCDMRLLFLIFFSSG